MKGDVSGKDSLDPLDPVSNPRTRQATRSVVFVLDASHRPLAPCHPARARRLLARQRAAVWRAQPFTLILRTRTDIPSETVQDTLQDMAAGAMASDEHREAAEVPNGSPLTGTSTRAAVPSTTHSPAAALSPSFPPGQGYRLKIDPGSKTTGLALVQETRDSTGQAGQMGRVLWAAELTHRGDQVNERLTQRRQCRRSRRQRHTRYRPARYRNRRRRDGWLPPSLESRIQNVLTWVERLRRWCPIDAISLELVKFDTQLLHNPELSGIQYQRGTLAGYELREYLLEKWGRRCAYCKRTNVPLKVEHMRPRRRHGSNAIWNLTLACKPCNERKGTRTAAEFGFPELEATGRRPLRDAAAVNATRWALFRRLEALGLPLETGTGGQTKWNRTRRTLPKTHWLDAACVGASTPKMLQVSGVQPLTVKATGRHSRQMCRTDAYGFPDKAPKATSVVCGLRTGDIVRAVVPPPSVKAGTYVGRLAVRATGWCNIMTSAGTIQSIHVRYCNLLQRGDGYTYQVVTAALPPVLENKGLRE